MSTQETPAGRSYTFGLRDRLRIAREQAGMEQRDLEEATGISRASISNYERGITRPRRPQILAWAMATGFDVRWVETGEHEEGGNGGPTGRHARTDVVIEPLSRAA